MRAAGKLVGLQRIYSDGSKYFWEGTQVEGANCRIGAKSCNQETNPTMYITEGWATAWTIHQATSCAVYVAFSANGLGVVAEKVRQKFSGVPIVIAADNDRWSSVLTSRKREIPNPGVYYARKAAESIDARVAIPDFRDLTDRPTDFDDLRRQEGEESVKRWLDPGNASSACTVADPERATDQPMSSTPDPATTPSELGDVDTPARHLGDDQHSDSDPDNESAELAAKRDEALEVVRELITDGNYEQARRELDALDSDETDSEPTNLKSELENASTPKTLRRIIDREDPGGSLPVWRDWTGEPEPREWLSSRWLPAGRVALLTADGGSAKTLLALQVAAIVAAGEGFHAPGSKGPAMLPANGGAKGMAPRLSGKAGAVVFATWEDEPDEVLRRLSWLPRLPGGKSVRAAVEKRLHIVDLAGRGALWGPKGDGHRDTLAGLTTTGSAFEAYVRHVKPRLIVIDPVAAAYGANENDRGAVRGFLSHLNALAAELGAAVLLVAHPPKGKDADHYSGSTDWRNGVRAMLTLGPEPVRGYVGKPTDKVNNQNGGTAEGQALTLEKANYARAGRRAWLRFKVEHGPDGPQGPPKIMAWEEVGPKDAADAYHKWRDWKPPRKKEPKESGKNGRKSAKASMSNGYGLAPDGKPVV